MWDCESLVPEKKISQGDGCTAHGVWSQGVLGLRARVDGWVDGLHDVGCLVEKEEFRVI